LANTLFQTSAVDNMGAPVDGRWPAYRCRQSLRPDQA